jgi:hypothetical protein
MSAKPPEHRTTHVAVFILTIGIGWIERPTTISVANPR